MRFALVLAAALAIAACGGPDTEPAPPVPIVPEWTCAGGKPLCPNATSGWGWPGVSETIRCDWACADYQGEIGRLVIYLDSACDILRIEPRVACG